MNFNVVKVNFRNLEGNFGIIVADGNNMSCNFKTHGFVLNEGDRFQVDLEALEKNTNQYGDTYSINTKSDWAKLEGTAETTRESVILKNRVLATFKFPRLKDYCPEEGVDTIWGHWKDSEGKKYVGTVNPENFVKNAVFSVAGKTKKDILWGDQIEVESIEIRSFDANKPEFLMLGMGFGKKSIDWAMRTEFVDMVKDAGVPDSVVEKEIRRGLKAKEFAGVGDKTIKKIMSKLPFVRKDCAAGEGGDIVDKISKFKKGVKDILVEFRVQEFWNNTEAGRVKYIDTMYKGFVELFEDREKAGDFRNRFKVKSLDGVVKLIRENPYCLIFLRNRGFKTVDKLALQLGFNTHSRERKVACLQAILSGDIQTGFGNSGDTYTDREFLNEQLNAALAVDETDGFGSAFEKQDAELLLQDIREGEAGSCKSWMELNDKDIIEEKFTTNQNFAEEKLIFDKIQEGVTGGEGKPILGALALRAWIIELEENEGKLSGTKYEFSQEQKDILIKVNENKKSVFCMTGFAGTGKSTVSKGILQLLEMENGGSRKGIECLAVSGMASRRITQATGFKSRTIMSYTFIKSMRGGVDKGLKVLFIDEASMVDNTMLCGLLGDINMKKVKVILVGDVGQLPPIGRGTPFKDILNSGIVETVSLKTIFRQNEGAVLTTFAKGMREEKVDNTMFDGKYDDFEFKSVNDKGISEIRSEIRRLEEEDEESGLDAWSKRVLSEKRVALSEEIEIVNIAIRSQVTRILNEYKANHKEEVSNFQLISPQKSTIVGTAELNLLAQDILNAEEKPFMDEDIPLGKTHEYKRFKMFDKVIHTKNENRVVGEKLGFYTDGKFSSEEEVKSIYGKYITIMNKKHIIRILNGMIGVIDNWDEDRKRVRVKYKYEDIDIGVEYDINDLRFLHLGYCLTVHKLQGSEVKTVAFVVSPSHVNMLDNNILYTGITRGKSMGYFIGSKRAFRSALKRHGTERQTVLGKFFGGGFWDVTDYEKKVVLYDKDGWAHSKKEYETMAVSIHGDETRFNEVIDTTKAVDMGMVYEKETDDDINFAF